MEVQIERALIYRPGGAIGIGHFIVCLVVYAVLAQRLRAQFLTTIANTVFDNGQPEESAFWIRHFQSTEINGCQLGLGGCAINGALKSLFHDRARAILIGREDKSGRPAREFPALADVPLLDRHADEEKIVPEYLSRFNLIYVDSVLPGLRLTRTLKQLRPSVELANLHCDRAAQAVPEHPYIAVHLRHGNGEYLNDRAQPGSDVFEMLLKHVARTAGEVASTMGIRNIICLSDNGHTAERLAELCGGITIGAVDLPQSPFQSALSEPSVRRSDLLDRAFLDLAVLSGAAGIVAGESQFVLAAKLLGAQKFLQIVLPDGTSYSVRDQDTGNKIRDLI
nr:hypothetical protein [uncultured Hyphomonas sp.]